MKNKTINLTIIIAILFILLGFSYSGFSRLFTTTDPQYIIDERNNIVATWVSEEDPKWRMVFTTEKCYNYYDNSLLSTSDYSINNNTPQCGEDVLVDETEGEQTSYLTLTNNNDGYNTCYEINGVTSLLSLRTIGTDNLLILVKQ